MTTQLEQLKKMTTVVADTGDIDAIQTYQPEDATTNPSLIYVAAQMPEYKHLVDEAIAYGKQFGARWLDEAMDKLAVNFGTELTRKVSGRVSTEVDACLSFDTKATVSKAKKLIQMYEQSGIGRDRILIKIAATWEGIQATKPLEQEGIQCNVTLVFNLTQAVACAEAGAFLISPFVGRILDWYKANTSDTFTAQTDPGCQSVSAIYHYLKHFNYATIVMGASFRSTEQVLQLAGCDRLTIAPALLQTLSTTLAPVTQQLNAADSKKHTIEKIAVDEANFRWQMNDDAMASEKLAEGIRKFNEDTLKLRAFLTQRVQ